MARSQPQREFYARVGAGIGLVTLLLTASFVGVLSLLAGETTGLETRMPYYLIAGAIVFVAAIVFLEDRYRSGRPVLVTSAIAGLVGLVGVSLVTEGALFAARFPGRVFVSQLGLYFFAAALVATGLGYWVLHHRREIGLTV